MPCESDSDDQEDTLELKAKISGNRTALPGPASSAKKHTRLQRTQSSVAEDDLERDAQRRRKRGAEWD